MLYLLNKTSITLLKTIKSRLPSPLVTANAFRGAQICIQPRVGHPHTFPASGNLVTGLYNWVPNHGMLMLMQRPLECLSAAA